MVVTPDFLDHWKTRMLVDLLDGDELAPFYVIRIWAHCESRRAWEFDRLPAAGLKSMCRFNGEALALETALIEAGFIEREGDRLSVPKWAEKNAALIAAWVNGKKGGRPRKKPTGNPPVTAGQPPDSPSPADGEPTVKAIREDRSRVEKIIVIDDDAEKDVVAVDGIGDGEIAVGYSQLWNLFGGLLKRLGPPGKAVDRRLFLTSAAIVVAGLMTVDEIRNVADLAKEDCQGNDGNRFASFRRKFVDACTDKGVSFVKHERSAVIPERLLKLPEPTSNGHIAAGAA